MPYPQPTVAFGDIVGIETARLLMVRGIRPGHGSIQTAATEQFTPPVADFTISYNGNALTIAACITTDTNVQASGDGWVRTINFADRRARWENSVIDGRYNVRVEHGAVKETIEFQKTPQELASLCLDALGETGYDVSALPNDARPQVDWRASRADLALEEIYAALGCDLAPQADGTFKIVVLGDGAALPTGLIEIPAYGVTRPPQPDAIRVIGGDVRYELWLQCEAIARDVDFAWKALDDVSYRPPTGWEFADLRSLSDIHGTYYDPSLDDTLPIRGLARTAFRCYRASGVYRGFIGGAQTFEPPGFDDALAVGVPHLTSIKQLLPLLPSLNATYTDPEDGLEKPRRPYAAAQYYVDLLAADVDEIPARNAAGNTLSFHRPASQPSIDLNTGILTFAQPLYLFNTYDLGKYPASVILRCCVNADFVGKNSKVYYGYEIKASGVTTPQYPLIVSRPEVVLKYNAKADGTATNNQTEVDNELGFYTSAMETHLEDREGGSCQYADLKIVDLDGAIEQIEWIVDGEGMTTRIARNTQITGYLPDYRDLVRQGKLHRAGEFYERNRI